MSAAALSSADAQALRDEITARPDAATTNIFCKDWPTAKSVLQALQSLLKNPIAKAAIGIVIQAGDAVQGAVCH
jgi:hypothetical protein